MKKPLPMFMTNRRKETEVEETLANSIMDRNLKIEEIFASGD